MSDCIAVINAGSSSVKFGIYAPGEAVALYRGQVEGIGTAPRLRIVNLKERLSVTAPGRRTVSTMS
jgi:acetate kinase